MAPLTIDTTKTTAAHNNRIENHAVEFTNLIKKIGDVTVAELVTNAVISHINNMIEQKKNLTEIASDTYTFNINVIASELDKKYKLANGTISNHIKNINMFPNVEKEDLNNMTFNKFKMYINKYLISSDHEKSKEINEKLSEIDYKILLLKNSKTNRTTPSPNTKLLDTMAAFKTAFDAQMALDASRLKDPAFKLTVGGDTKTVAEHMKAFEGTQYASDPTAKMVLEQLKADVAKAVKVVEVKKTEGAPPIITPPAAQPKPANTFDLIFRMQPTQMGDNAVVLDKKTDLTSSKKTVTERTVDIAISKYYHAQVVLPLKQKPGGPKCNIHIGGFHQEFKGRQIDYSTITPVNADGSLGTAGTRNVTRNAKSERTTTAFVFRYTAQWPLGTGNTNNTLTFTNVNNVRHLSEPFDSVEKSKNITVAERNTLINTGVIENNPNMRITGDATQYKLETLKTEQIKRLVGVTGLVADIRFKPKIFKDYVYGQVRAQAQGGYVPKSVELNQAKNNWQASLFLEGHSRIDFFPKQQYNLALTGHAGIQASTDIQAGPDGNIAPTPTSFFAGYGVNMRYSFDKTKTAASTPNHYLEVVGQITSEHGNRQSLQLSQNPHVPAGGPLVHVLYRRPFGGSNKPAAPKTF